MGHDQRHRQTGLTDSSFQRKWLKEARRRIHGTGSSQMHPSHSRLLRLGAGLLGLLFISMGLVAVLGAIGYLAGRHPIPSSERAAVCLVAGVFLSAGCGLLFFGIGRNRSAARLGGLALLAFLVTFNWMAFGPGERNFRRTISSSFSQASSTVGETEGRAVFGIVAGALDILIIYGFVKARRRDARRFLRAGAAAECRNKAR